MNRYELHEALKQAREEGRNEGYTKGLKDGQGTLFAQSNHPLPRASTGKPRLVAQFVKLPTYDAYELQAKLFVGDKYYFAKQTFDRYIIERLVAQGDTDEFERNVNHWVEGATHAILKEFAKDIEYTSPRFIEE